MSVHFLESEARIFVPGWEDGETLENYREEEWSVGAVGTGEE